MKISIKGTFSNQNKNLELKRKRNKMKYCKRPENNSNDRLSKGDMAYILNLQNKLHKLKGGISPVRISERKILKIYN